MRFNPSFPAVLLASTLAIMAAPASLGAQEAAPGLGAQEAASGLGAQEAQAEPPAGFGAADLPELRVIG